MVVVHSPRAIPGGKPSAVRFEPAPKKTLSPFTDKPREMTPRQRQNQQSPPGSTHRALQAARAAASSSGKSPHAAFMMIFGPKRMPQQSSKRLSPLDQLSPRGAHGLGSSAGSHAPEGPHVAPGADAEKGTSTAHLAAWKDGMPNLFRDKSWYLYPTVGNGGSTHDSPRVASYATPSTGAVERATHNALRPGHARVVSLDDPPAETTPRTRPLDGKWREEIVAKIVPAEVRAVAEARVAAPTPAPTPPAVGEEEAAVESPPPPIDHPHESAALLVSASVEPSPLGGGVHGHHAEGNPASREHLLQQMHLQHGLSEEQIIGQLRKVKWFAQLSTADLHALYGRAKHKFFPRYSTIIREGNVGSSFYVLLQGQTRCTSSVKNLNVVLGAGASFGEGALVTQVRREASVTALEHSYLLQFTAADMDGLAVELSEVRLHVISLILQKANFFRALTKHQRETLALIMDVAYFKAGQHIFEEGDPGNMLYVIIEGRVQMFKHSTLTKERDNFIAEYTTHQDRPWFGELALWSSKPRAASAICLEPTKVLVVRSCHFSTFLETIPTFSAMFATSANAYAALNVMMQQQEASSAMSDSLLPKGLQRWASSPSAGSKEGEGEGEEGEEGAAGRERSASPMVMSTLPKWEALAAMLMGRDEELLHPRDQLGAGPRRGSASVSPDDAHRRPSVMPADGGRRSSMHPAHPAQGGGASGSASPGVDGQRRASVLPQPAAGGESPQRRASVMGGGAASDGRRTSVMVAGGGQGAADAQRRASVHPNPAGQPSKEGGPAAAGEAMPQPQPPSQPQPSPSPRRGSTMPAPTEAAPRRSSVAAER